MLKDVAGSAIWRRRAGSYRFARLKVGTPAAVCKAMRNILVCVFTATTLLVTGAAAQHEGHQSGSATPAVDKSAETPMMGQMMAARADATKLVEQLAKSFTGLENETDPAALKVKLAEHGKLLKELQAKLQGEAKMMEQMHGMMMGEHAK